VKYRDPTSVSSQLGRILEDAQALHAACADDPVDLERARRVQDELWVRARGGEHARSRELATLALAVCARRPTLAT
jgi:hypothetical protein